MGVLSAPLDEIIEIADQVEGWLDINRVLDQAINGIMQPIFNLTDWTGDSAKVFSGMVKQAIVDELGWVLTLVDAFLSAIRAIISAIEDLVRLAEMFDPFSWF